MRRLRFGIAISLALLLLSSGAQTAFGFPDEPIGFRDPATGAVWDDPASTLHADLVHVLALAAGFPRDTAAKIAVWSQLADSGRLGPDGEVTYSNCLGSTAPAPDRDTVCTAGYGDGLAVWPETFDPACVTSRTGPYGPFFHFAGEYSAELDALRQWGWGRSATLNGFGAYAWGGAADTVLTAPCRHIRPETIQTGLKAGSIEAFSTFLHALTDSYSHRDCTVALAALQLTDLWGTHTPPGIVPECSYDPANPDNGDAHGRQFGTGTDTLRGMYALERTFEEMVDRSTSREGRFFPFDCETVLNYLPGKPMLQEAMAAAITSWEMLSTSGEPGDAAASRRAAFDAIKAAVLAQRKPAPRPTVSAISPTSVLKAGLGRDVRIVVTGTGFRRTTVAQLGWSNVPTAYRSPTRLVVTIPAAAIEKEGRAGLTVYDNRGGGGTRPRTFAYRYPTPVIGSLLPASASAGSAPFTLTVRGSRFVAASVVRWTRGGVTVDLPTTYVSPTELSATVDAALIAAAGPATVRVATVGAATKVSAGLRFTVSAP